VHRIVFAFVFVFMMVAAGWYAFQYQQDDPAGRATLESWAAGREFSVSREPAGFHCELSATVEGGEEWLLNLQTRATTDAGPAPGKRPARFLVEVNEHSSSVGIQPDGSFVIGVPLHSFHLNQRSNDVRMVVIAQDGSELFGWAHANIVFDEVGVSQAEPSWFEVLTD
jgi:hypothetical protein